MAAYTGTGTGWSGSWTQKGGATNINAKVKTWGTWTDYTALTYTNGGAAGPNVTTATGQEAYRAFSSGIDTNAEGTYYFSFLVNADATAGEGFSNFVFANAQTDSFSNYSTTAGQNTTVAATVDNNGLLYLRSQNISGSTTGISLTKGADYLVVGKMELTNSGNDSFRISAFQNGASVSEPVTWGNSISLNNTFALNGFGMRMNQETVMGGFRVGDSFATVVPEPATWALLAGNLTVLYFFRRSRRQA